MRMHKPMAAHKRMCFDRPFATTGAAAAPETAFLPKALSPSQSWITSNGFCNQWSHSKASKAFADKSKVATTALLHEVYL